MRGHDHPSACEPFTRDWWPLPKARLTVGRRSSFMTSHASIRARTSQPSVVGVGTLQGKAGSRGPLEVLYLPRMARISQGPALPVIHELVLHEPTEAAPEDVKISWLNLCLAHSPLPFSSCRVCGPLRGGRRGLAPFLCFCVVRAEAPYSGRLTA